MKNKEQDLLGCHLTRAFLPESYHDIFVELFGVDAESFSGGERVYDSSVDNLPAAQKAILREAEHLVGAINESIKIVQGSNVVNTRKYEIAASYAKIIELRRMTTRHPNLRLDRLEEVLLLIAQIEQETVALQYQDNTESGQDGRKQEKQGKMAEAITAYEGFVRKVTESNKKHYDWLKNRLSKIRQKDDPPS